MPYLDDSNLGDHRIKIVNPSGRREITHVIHDIDGTHSIIRDWPPVMSLSMYWAMTCGYKEDYDCDETTKELIARVGSEALPETDKICYENAGFSAITQLEYGVRRAIELGNIPEELKSVLAKEDMEKNSEIVKRIQNGKERFEDIKEIPQVGQFIDTHTPKLFQQYEKILNGACRDKNTADAYKNPEKWRVAGSLEYIKYLHDIGCINYFVTGAVIYEEGGMFEEVVALGYEIGPGKMIESLEGSSWDKKMPKNEVMEEIYTRDGIVPEKAFVIGDGRTEIESGVNMGSITMSRFFEKDVRLREIHTELGVNFIVEDYTDPALRKLVSKD